MNTDRPRGPTSGPGDQPTPKERKLIPSQVDLQSYPLTRRPEPNRAAWSQDVATIIAFDPGGTTGWSMMHVHPDALEPEHPDVGILSNIFEWSHGQIDCGSRKGNLATTLDPGISTDGENAGVQRMCDLIRAWPAAAVVIEGFTLRNHSKDQDLLSPQRLKAAVGFWMWQCRREYFVQSPAEGKVTATDSRLKSWGLYSPLGGMNHARDADRHAITFLRRASTIDGLRKRAWPHLYDQPAEEE